MGIFIIIMVEHSDRIEFKPTKIDFDKSSR